MNEKQQQLTFGKGVTNVPSDAICSDNTLEESLGMVYDDGEHRVIQKPEEFITDSNLSAIPKILYVHRVGNEERFITSFDGAGAVPSCQIQWGTVSNLIYTNVGQFQRSDGAYNFQPNVKVTSVGNTLIISDSMGMYYFLWKNDSYLSLGGKIPEPQVSFHLGSGDTQYVSEVWDNRKENGDWDDSIWALHDFSSSDPFHSGPVIIDQEAYNNLVIGYYRKLCDKASEQKRFTRPFMARYALELYDGEYIYISNPVVLFPSVNINGWAHLYQNNKVMYLLGYSALLYKSSTDYSNWKDLVRGVTIFVSQQVDVVDTTSDQIIRDATEYDVLRNGLGFMGQRFSNVTRMDAPDGQRLFYWICYKFNDSTTILNNLKGISNFYKLCDIGTATTSGYTDIAYKVDSNTLKNITTQQQLPYDDYYSHSLLTPGFIYSYNMRLNVADVSRSFFSGFTEFVPYQHPTDSSSRTYTIYVHIASEEGEKVVSQTVTTNYYMGIYFFYPDTRATKAQIFVGNTRYFNFTLEEHPYLNGAYYFRGLPTGNETDSTTSITAPTESNSPEHLVNYLIQSEVNNPFVFKAEGYHRVGMGRIIGMSSITQALSEGQFGQYPLLVFATDGIWAMSVNTQGIYTSVHPMSREVALESNPCLTQTDGAVFFASEKGLMVVVGNQVKCVSEQLSGKKVPLWFESFVDFLRGAVIAYDYRDSMLWMFKNPYRAALVYSIKSGTFARFDSSIPIISTVNYYPDYLIQQGTTWHVYSMLNRLDINEDDSEYTGSIVTRPLKLENALALKSITQVRHIHDMNASATLSFHILASNNLKDWVELSSLRGTPWKYYKFSYDFNHLKATDRFSGTVVVTEERRTNKLR